MRNPQGCIIIVGPDVPVREIDTFTCGHCQRICLLKTGEDPRDQNGFCMPCFKPICGPCADTGKCDPFEKKLEEYERHYESRKALFRTLELR